MPKCIDRNFWSKSRRSSIAAANGEAPQMKEKQHKMQNQPVSEDDLDSFDNSMDDDNESLSLEDDDAEIYNIHQQDNNQHRKKLLYHQIGGGSMRSSLESSLSQDNSEESDEQEEAKNLAQELNPGRQLRNDAQFNNKSTASYNPKTFQAEETLDDFNSEIEEQIIKNKQ